MQLAGGGAAYHHGYVQAGVVHLVHHAHHLLQAGGDESAQSYQVHLLFDGFPHDLRGGHHHAHIDDLVVVAGHHHGHDVLAYVVHIAFHGGQQYLARFLAVAVAAGLDIGLQDAHGLFHGAGGLHHLRQKHLAASEEVAHQVHALHEGAFDDAHRGRVGGQCLFQVGLQVVADAFAQGVDQSLLHALLAPLLFPGLWFGRVGAALGGLLGCLHLFGQFHQALRGAGVAVQYHVFYDVELLGGQVVVGHFGGGVHDTEVHAGLYGVVEEHGVHGLADIVVAPEGEREVAHTAAHMGAR